LWRSKNQSGTTEDTEYHGGKRTRIPRDLSVLGMQVAGS
jgi:hypothetical protein